MKALGLCFLCALLCFGCAGVPLVTYTAADVRKPENLYRTKIYPEQNIAGLRQHLTEYKMRCGMLPIMTEGAVNFETLSDTEAVLFGPDANGTAVVMQAREQGGHTTITIWARNWRIAEYLTNAVEGGACINSLWDSRMKEHKGGR